MEDMKRNEMPVREYYVATDVKTGAEEWFRGSKIQGFRPEVVMAAARDGSEAYGYRWRRVPVYYWLMTKYGQKFCGRWDPSKRAFLVPGGLLVGRSWCVMIKEVLEDGGVQG